MRTNIITVDISGGQDCVVAPDIRWEHDLVQYMQIVGAVLPANYQVDFCNVGDSDTIAMIGNEYGVLIPDQLIATGLPIEAYLYLQTGDSSWNTEVKFIINVLSRPNRTDIEPTPEEQTTIDSLVAAMNRVVADGVGIPAGGSSGQVLSKKSDADYDVGWENGGGSGGGLFVVTITGSGSSRTSDKTPTEIKAAYDAGMTVVANIVSENKMAYPFTIGSVQVTFCSLPQGGLSNEYDSMMVYYYTITGISSTSVSVTYLSVTSADSLLNTVYPSAQFWFTWNEHGYQPVYLTQYDATQWSNFYYTGNMNHVGVLNFTKIDAEGDWTGTETYISRDVWQTEEYYEPYDADVAFGNIIFVKTEIDGNTLKTTEIYVKHMFEYGEIFIESRKVATCSVTVTTDYPQPYWPE